MSQPFFVRLLIRSERTHIHKLRKRPPNIDVYRRVQAVHLSSKHLKVYQIAEIVGRFADAMLAMGAEFDKQQVMNQLNSYYAKAA